MKCLAALLSDLHQIQSNAEHQLRVINDLLDLSRAEIDELDLSLELLDPHQLLMDAFHDLADQSTSPEHSMETRYSRTPAADPCGCCAPASDIS